MRDSSTSTLNTVLVHDHASALTAVRQLARSIRPHFEVEAAAAFKTSSDAPKHPTIGDARKIIADKTPSLVETFVGELAVSGNVGGVLVDEQRLRLAMVDEISNKLRRPASLGALQRVGGAMLDRSSIAVRRHFNQAGVAASSAAQRRRAPLPAEEDDDPDAHIKAKLKPGDHASAMSDNAGETNSWGYRFETTSWFMKRIAANKLCDVKHRGGFVLQNSGIAALAKADISQLRPASDADAVEVAAANKRIERRREFLGHKSVADVYASHATLFSFARARATMPAP